MGIGVNNADHVTVANNTVVNPVAQKLNTELNANTPFPHPNAILLDGVGPATQVVNNRVTQIDPTVVNTPIGVTAKTAPNAVNQVDNVFTDTQGNPVG